MADQQQQPPLTIQEDGRPVDVVFVEATPAQAAQCTRLAASAFRGELSEDAYARRGAHLRRTPQLRGGRRRVWCLVRAAAPDGGVLASCLTLARDMLVRDYRDDDDGGGNGVLAAQGCCIAAVVADPAFRGRGLAPYMLRCLAARLDAENAGAPHLSMLYSDVGSYYVDKGWVSFPSSHILLDVPTGELAEKDGWPQTRPLGKGDVEALCQRDVGDLRKELLDTPASADPVPVLMPPTVELVSCQHEWAEFVGLELNGQSPDAKGAISDDGNTWLFWHHDFAARQLFVQRLRFGKNHEEARLKDIAAVVLAAVKEAQKWKIPTVVIWNMSPEVLDAVSYLSKELGIGHKHEERAMKLLGVRWRAPGDKRQMRFLADEYFMWN